MKRDLLFIPGQPRWPLPLARIELGDRAARMLAEEHRTPFAAVRWRAAVAQGGVVVAVSIVLEPGITWRTRMPRGVLDPRCPRGEPLTASADRRMLWHLQGLIAVTAASDMLRQAAADLRAYLGETCEHHWHDYEGDDEIAAFRHCLWCDETEPLTGTGPHTVGEQHQDHDADPGSAVPRVRLLAGQAALIRCPHCDVPMTRCPHGGSYTGPEVRAPGAAAETAEAREGVPS